MIAVIDSSSLLSLVRYYLPFDKNSLLFDCIQEKVKANEIVILDKVYDEIKYLSKGIVTEKLPFLADKKHHTKTMDILPYPKFYNQLENQFCVTVQKKKLKSDAEFEMLRNRFLDSADAKLILYSLSRSKASDGTELAIVTEESAVNNDSKLFKKIPLICDMLNIQTMTLPQLLGSYSEIDLHIK
ncbi:DUF4411 family protein (plasmid) [Mucilaginibacter robiniae]|uniref:DUF4411 family protein n=1 Tax=Mucilaginibacter robiniae TaxID=2728022 RepID=A0A7L5E5L9_9SPHI|nr:DUF4411 family protein [Mucilaginibacter robiniae]QJD98572.1 DUF4411 family protein [Mucilaginibacter robiniae]